MSSHQTIHTGSPGGKPVHRLNKRAAAAAKAGGIKPMNRRERRAFAAVQKGAKK